mmetsp:Transcript_14961/g.38046  ORF Transcript_14961/g.38046 Transcript_14961/m.38046 type:complete len:221 (+) Transcript_14961:872-1534(+)
MLGDQVDGDVVDIPPARDDDVREPLAGENELVEHGLDKLGVLGDDVVDVPTTLQGVALDAPRETQVVVGVDEDLHVQLLHELLHVQDEDALHDDDLTRVHQLAAGLLRVRLEVVVGDVHGDLLLQLAEAIQKKRLVEGIRVVEVVLCNVLLLLLGEPSVESVLGDEDHPLVGKPLDDLVAHGGLPGSRPAGHANHEGLVVVRREGRARRTLHAILFVIDV